MGEKARQLVARGVIGAIRAVGDLALDAAGSDRAHGAIAAQPAIEGQAAIAGDVDGGDVGRVEFLSPLGGNAFFGNLVVSLSGEVCLTRGAVETAKRNHGVHQKTLFVWGLPRESLGCGNQFALAESFL